MSRYTYNDIAIQEPRTLEFRMETERDPSGTDILWNKYTVRVRGFVSDSLGGWRSDSAAALTALKDRLQVPRRPFRYIIGTDTMVAVDPIDAKLGPEPLPTIVTQVATGTFMVEHGVICRVVNCDNECETRSAVVSLRWTQTESFDETWNSNLSTSGKLIVRSDLLRSADSFRDLATPPILPDYRRVVAKYTLSPNGLELDFEFLDKEVDRLPPFPAVKANGTFTVHVDKAHRMGRCHVHLEGPKGTSRKALLLRALAMVYSKIKAENPIIAGGQPIFVGDMTEDMFEPVVDVSLSAKLMPLGFGGKGLAGRAIGFAAGVLAERLADREGKIQSFLSIGDPPAGVSDGKPGLAPPIRKRIAALLAAGFRDPCVCEYLEQSVSTTRGISGRASLESPPSAVGDIPVYTLSISSVPTGPSARAITVDAAPYDTYQIERTLAMDPGKLHMPGTGVGADGAKAAVLNVHGGLSRMITTWVAGRTGEPPVLPAVDEDDNLAFLGGAVVAKETVPNADASCLVYLVSGYYIHAVRDPSLAQIVSAVPPTYGPAVVAGAQVASKYWTSIANFTGVQKANPLVDDGVQLDQPPQIPQDFTGDVALVPTLQNPGINGDDPQFTAPTEGFGGNNGNLPAPVVNP